MDVLRGKVKVHNHCYEAVDLDGVVSVSGEWFAASDFEISGCPFRIAEQ